MARKDSKWHERRGGEPKRKREGIRSSRGEDPSAGDDPPSVPDENRPGHKPGREQDQPTDVGGAGHGGDPDAPAPDEEEDEEG